MSIILIYLLFVYFFILNLDSLYTGSAPPSNPLLGQRTSSALVLCMLPPALLYLLFLVAGHEAVLTVPIALLLGLLVVQGGLSLAVGTRSQSHPLASFLWFHGSHLILFWVVASGFDLPRLPVITGAVQNGLIVAVGGLFLAGPASHFVFAVIRPYSRELGDETELTGAGKTIGQLERLMIYLLYLAGHVGVIGFLIAAKSILRFGEVNQEGLPVRKHTEYVIIGTLWSFLLGLLVAWAVRRILGHP